MKRTSPSRLSRPIRILIYAACTLFVVLILLPTWNHTPRSRSRQVSCMSNLKYIGLETMTYLQDWDNCLPSAPTWMNDMYSYMKNIKNGDYFRCPELLHQLEETGAEYKISATVPWPEDKNDHSLYGYAFNSALSRKLQTKIPDPANTPLVFDSDLSVRNAALPPTILPNPPRHNGRNNFVYVDGHAKWKVKTPK